VVTAMPTGFNMWARILFIELSILLVYVITYMFCMKSI